MLTKPMYNHKDDILPEKIKFCILSSFFSVISKIYKVNTGPFKQSHVT